MSRKISKPKKVEISTDGHNWQDVTGHVNCRCCFPSIPGGLTMRLPQYVARFWAAGRQVDSKRAGALSTKKTEAGEKYRIKFIGGEN